MEPIADLVTSWNATGGAATIGQGARAVGQIPICWGPDAEAATAMAHDQCRWFAGGWKVNADLPNPAGFAGATQFVTAEDVAGSIIWEAGFTDIALVQVGDESQQRFLDEAAGPLLEKLRAAAP